MARSDIEALGATVEQGLEKADAALVASVYGPGARLVPPGSDVLTGDAIEQYWQQVLNAGVTGARRELVSLEEHGDAAVEEGRYELRIGDQVGDRGTYVVVHHRQPDGGWRFHLDIFNSSMPTAAPA
jgi:uncharacterized protein (TIGR02246 family)